MRPNLDKLCEHLGYQFVEPSSLEAALSHRSAQGQNNERLEFLGDSIVNFIIAEALYKRFPAAREGELTRLRASLVKGETLTEMAQEFSIGDYLRLGMGELKSGGHRRASILADAMEAIIGAIYLETGFERCQQIVVGWYESRLTESALASQGKDAKTQLQEYLQAKKKSLPNYQIKKITGDAHKQMFYVECQVADIHGTATGSGRSRRRAEQEAAEAYLKLMMDQKTKVDR